jgi:4-hydroxybenzoate polyprenyltransferase
MLAMLLLVLGFFISWGERFVLLIMAFLSILYNPPIDQQRLLLPLRSIPFLKIFLISIVWSMLGSVYPWSVLGFRVQEAVVWRLFAGMFLFILGITLPFDVRDTEDDKSGGLPTVAHLFDIHTTRLLGAVAVMLAGVLIWPLYPVKVFLMMTMGCTAALVYAARPDRPFWYFQGFLDGTIPALYLATILSLHVQPVVQ